MLVGALCFANSGLLFMNIAFLVGMGLLVTGAVSLFSYLFGIGETRKEASWFLSESILVIVLSVLILINQISSDTAVPYVFGMQLVTSGILRLVLVVTRKGEMDGFEYKSNRATGAVGMLLGIYFFMNSSLLNLNVAVLSGIAMALHGLNIVFFGIAMPPKERLRLKDDIEDEDDIDDDDEEDDEA